MLVVTPLTESRDRMMKDRLNWSSVSLLLALLLQPIVTPLRAAEVAAADPGARGVRQQLSIGYSLLYGEGTGVHKRARLLSFKSKSEEMSQATDVLMKYYKGLAERMEKLAKQFPAVRLDAKT